MLNMDLTTTCYH